MKIVKPRFTSLLTVSVLVLASVFAFAQDPLPSWNDGPAKRGILDFVKATTDKESPAYVPPEARIAAFDQDGTTCGGEFLHEASGCSLKNPGMVPH